LKCYKAYDKDKDILVPDKAVACAREFFEGDYGKSLDYQVKWNKDKTKMTAFFSRNCVKLC